MRDLTDSLLALAFVVGAAALWTWTIRFVVEVTANQALPWSTCLVATVVIGCVRVNWDSDAESLGDAVGRLVGWALVKPAVVALAALLLSAWVQR